jgi:hypothetical protein
MFKVAICDLEKSVAKLDLANISTTSATGEKFTNEVTKQ